MGVAVEVIERIQVTGKIYGQIIWLTITLYKLDEGKEIMGVVWEDPDKGGSWFFFGCSVQRLLLWKSNYKTEMNKMSKIIEHFD